MSDEAIIAELERQREFARQCFAHYARQEELGVILESPKPDISEITRPLAAILTAHPVFGPGHNVFFATKQLNLHPPYATHGLLRMMLASDAPSAVAWLRRLFEIDRADLRMVAAVHASKCSRRSAWSTVYVCCRSPPRRVQQSSACSPATTKSTLGR